MLSPLIATVLALAPLDDDIGRAVERALTTWHDAGSSQQLVDDLTALGPRAAPYVCAQLDAQPQDGSEVPLLQALGGIGTERSWPTLEHWLADDAPGARAAAARSTGQLAILDASPALLSAVDDPELSVRGASLDALVAIASAHPAGGVDRALVARLDEAPDKGPLARALGQIGSARARAQLLKLIGAWSEEPDRLAGLGGLWYCAGEPEARAVHELLLTCDSLAVRRKACLVLGRVQHGPATRALLDLLRSDVRGLAADAHWALKKISGLSLRLDAAMWEGWWQRAGKRTFPPPQPR